MIISRLYYAAWSFLGDIGPRAWYSGYLMASPLPQEPKELKKKVVVLAHGKPSSPRLWWPYVQAFKAHKDFSVLVPTFTGTVEEEAEKMRKTLPEGAEIYWIGHSFGGMVGRALADRLHTLALADSRQKSNVKYNFWHGFLKDRGVFDEQKAFLEENESKPLPAHLKVFVALDPWDWLVPKEAMELDGDVTYRSFKGYGHLGTMFAAKDWLVSCITGSKMPQTSVFAPIKWDLLIVGLLIGGLYLRYVKPA